MKKTKKSKKIQNKIKIPFNYKMEREVELYHYHDEDGCIVITNKDIYVL